jgi:ABC-2 type transport system ATP-binding protein
MNGGDGPGIEAVDLARSYNGGIRAVDRISLTVSRGEIYGLLGPNGAGKSTLILMLTTLTPPTSGFAQVGGYDIVREPRQVRRVTGATLQDIALDPLLTGREHLRLQAALEGMRRADGRRRAEELLVQLGLDQAAGRRVRGYSGGMKRRLDLAMALVHRPSILFLDEPTTGLDPSSRATLWAEVRRLAREAGVTVLLTTHYLEEADALADRVGFVDHGRIVAEGTPKELKAKIGTPTVEITPATPADTARVLDAVHGLGDIISASPGVIALRLGEGRHGLTEINEHLGRERVAVTSVRLRLPTLEDVFFAATGRLPERT